MEFQTNKTKTERPCAWKCLVFVFSMKLNKISLKNWIQTENWWQLLSSLSGLRFKLNCLRFYLNLNAIVRNSKEEIRQLTIIWMWDLSIWAKQLWCKANRIPNKKYLYHFHPCCYNTIENQTIPLQVASIVNTQKTPNKWLY